MPLKPVRYMRPVEAHGIERHEDEPRKKRNSYPLQRNTLSQLF
jgi:hypothetical protein